MRLISRNSRRTRSSSSSASVGFHRSIVLEQLEARTILSAADLDTTFDADGFARAIPNATFTATAVQADGKIVAVGSLSGGPDGDGNFLVARFNANGSLDTTFGVGDGITQVDIRDEDVAVDVLITPQGKIVIGGYSTSTFDVGTDWSVARLNANGSPDKSFSGDGKATFHIADLTTEVVNAMALQSDGKLVLTGTSYIPAGNGSPARNFMLIGRVTANGAFDTTFGCTRQGYRDLALNGYSFTSASVQVQTDGKIVALVTAERNAARVNGTADWGAYLVRFDSAGELVPGNNRRLIDIANYYKSSPDFENVVRANTTDLILLPSGNVTFGVNVVYRNDSADDVQSSLVVKTDPQFYTVDFVAEDLDINGSHNRTTAVTSLVRSADYFYVGGHTAYGKFTVSRYNAATLNRDLTFNPPTYPTGQASHSAIYFDRNTEYAFSYDLAVDNAGRVLLAGSRGYFTETGETVYLTESTLGRIVADGPAVPADRNDQFHEAVALPIGGTVSGSIATPTDVTMYKFTVEAGQNIGFDVDNNGSGLDGYLRLFDRYGVETSTSDDDAAPGEQLGVSPYLYTTFVNAGTWYIAVCGKGNVSFNPLTGTNDLQGSSGGFTLTTFLVDSDRLSTATGIAVAGAIATASIDTPTDVDLFKFTVSAGQTVDFDVDDSGNGFDGYLRLFDATGNPIAANDNAAAPGEQLGTSPYLRRTFTSGGTFYVGVSGKGNQSYNAVTGTGDTAGSVGAYSLRIETVSNAADPNDRISTAISAPLNSTRTNQSIANATDVDVFRFTVKAGQRVGFDVDTLGSPLDGYLRLFNANGTQIAFNDNGVAPGEQIVKSPYLAYTFATGGTYFIAVSSKGNQSYSVNSGLGDMPGSVGGYVLDLRVL